MNRLTTKVTDASLLKALQAYTAARAVAQAIEELKTAASLERDGDLGRHLEEIITDLQIKQHRIQIVADNYAPEA